MKKFSFVLVMLALALVLGLAFVGCDNGGSAGVAIAEEAFMDVWSYFDYPRINSWDENGRQFLGIDFYQKGFSDADLQAARAYWGSLPTSYYRVIEGPNENSGGVPSGLTLTLQLRADNRDNRGNERYLQLELNYPLSGRRTLIYMDYVAPDKVLEIAKGMVDRVR